MTKYKEIEYTKQWDKNAFPNGLIKDIKKRDCSGNTYPKLIHGATTYTPIIPKTFKQDMSLDLLILKYVYGKFLTVSKMKASIDTFYELTQQQRLPNE